MKKAGGAAQGGFVQMVAQIGNHAEAGVVDQVSAQIIAEAFGQRGGHQRNGHNIPGIVLVHEMGNEEPEVEVPPAVGEA